MLSRYFFQDEFIYQESKWNAFQNESQSPPKKGNFNDMLEEMKHLELFFPRHAFLQLIKRSLQKVQGKKMDVTFGIEFTTSFHKSVVEIDRFWKLKK